MGFLEAVMVEAVVALADTAPTALVAPEAPAGTARVPAQVLVA